MQNFWDERYNSDEFIYGTEPNSFLVEKLEKLSKGKILFPAEGEGRNAVYAATLGWDVTAFDSSSVAKEKAEKLAKIKKVRINYIISDFSNVEFPLESFDVVSLIFAHMPPEQRAKTHQKLIRFLKPGGVLILEGFSKNQINYNSGGPKNIDMLFSTKELRSDFDMLSEIIIEEKERTLNEGKHHIGLASVIQLYGIK